MVKEIEKPKGCIHHWDIETAKGPYSKGKCKICNLEKTFENSIATRQISLMNVRDDGRIGIVIS